VGRALPDHLVDRILVFDQRDRCELMDIKVHVATNADVIIPRGGLNKVMMELVVARLQDQLRPLDLQRFFVSMAAS
jgi:hypothetical protein